MHSHQMAAGLFMGGIEIDDRRRDPVFRADGEVRGSQTNAETSHQPFMDRLALGKDPDAKRGVEVIHAFENPLAEPRGVEEQRMDLPALGGTDNAIDVNLYLLGIEMDRKPARDKTAAPGILEYGTQFAHNLA